MTRRKKAAAAALGGLLAVGIVAGSFAYWNQTSTIDNPFDTGKYGSTAVEDFKPEDANNWQPGVDINKDVYAVNNGDQDLLVRVKLDETWTRKGEATPYKTVNANAAKDVYTVNQVSATDGKVDADRSVVEKKFSNSTNWIDGGDGWFYYKVNLPGGQTTDKWLDSVELIDDADMGYFQTKYYVTTDADANTNNWTEYNPESGMPEKIGSLPVLHNKVETSYVNTSDLGYSNSDYDLLVTVQTVQATQEALDAVFGGGSAFTAPSGTTWVLGERS